MNWKFPLNAEGVSACRTVPFPTETGQPSTPNAGHGNSPEKLTFSMRQNGVMSLIED